MPGRLPKLKKIDKLLLWEFLPPFVLAFIIAMFVLVMQFLWLYIDDIAGKGVGILVLTEMIFYTALSLIPMALPIAVLLASVMVYGNLAEKYELASLKSAGIPLMRVMRATMVFAAVTALSSYLCSNYVIPYANLKSRSRLYDIKRQKPALSLESGVFNDDFQGYSIRIGRKHADNQTIEDVMIDNDLYNQRNQFNFIRASRGKMFLTEENDFFNMHLEDGWQYQKAEPSSLRSKFPMIRTKFATWSKSFDLGEFDLNQTDETLFKSYHAMLSTRQLAEGVDSIQLKIEGLQENLLDNAWSKMDYFYYDPQLDSVNQKRIDINKESYEETLEFEKEDRKEKKFDEGVIVPMDAKKLDRGATRPMGAQKLKKSKTPKRSFGVVVISQPALDSLDVLESVVYTFTHDKQVLYVDQARNAVRSAKNFSFETKQKTRSEKERKQRYIYQLHSKYGFAVVCFIFLFIGAPMGAIVRKGGFGYPLLVAIIFFMLFIILTKIFEKLSRSQSLDAMLAAWFPCLILFPLGLFLTFKAMNDSKLLNTDRIATWFSKLFAKGT